MEFGRIARVTGSVVLLLGSVTACSSDADAIWVEGRVLPSASPSPSPSAAASQAAPSSPSSPAPSSPASGTPSSRPAATGDPDRFVEAVRRQLPELAMDRRDEEIADLGSEACASLRTDDQDNLSAYGVTAAQARQLRGVARADLCP
ncbi:hypothetical protein [Actinoplanes cyaneus]|uniref:hypothetical protein n=1 Tax=Actinoplanes cyaneus TaxID=52696 RepID=UPI001943C2BB|nr:hypothetical protein [Actinoplanes cyaneus]